MVELSRREPECGGPGGGPETARVEPLPTVGLLGIRADLSNAAVREALETACRMPLPAVRECRFSNAEGTGLYWMSPDELLLRLPVDEAPAAQAAIESALSGMRSLVVELSDSRAFFRVSGPFAREALAKAAPVDLHPSVFRPGAFRRTRAAGIAAAIAMRSENPDAFELFCARSYARYMRDWLVNAVRPGTMTGIYPPGEAVEPGSANPVAYSTMSRTI